MSKKKSLVEKICVLKANSPAIHKLGDIQREYDDLFIIKKDLGDKWEGAFVTGFGFIGVKVDKENVRAFTNDEWEKKFKGNGVQISNQMSVMFHKEDFAIEELP